MNPFGLYTRPYSTKTGVWFFGPVTENGAAGGSDLYYVKAPTPEELLTAVPSALPAEGDGILTHLSVTNGAVFMARDTLGCVSFDAGETWSECNIPLDSSLDTFWDGSYYFNGIRRSADGITWATGPAVVAGVAKVLLARDSDGAVICYFNNVVYKSFDSAETWSVAWSAGASVGPFMTTDGIRIWYLVRTSAVQYTDDLFATQTEFGSGDYVKSWLGNDKLVFMKYLNQGFGKFNADGSGYSTTLTGAVPASAADSPASFGQNKFVVAGINTVPTPDENSINVSTDSGATWTTLSGTIYGIGRNLAYVATP